MLALALRMLAAVTGRRRGPRTLLESGRRFRELAQLTTDVVLVCDDGGIIRYASPAVADYGYPADRLLGTRLDELVHPEDRPGSRRAVAAALAPAVGAAGQVAVPGSRRRRHLAARGGDGIAAPESRRG